MNNHDPDKCPECGCKSVRTNGDATECAECLEESRGKPLGPRTCASEARDMLRLDEDTLNGISSPMVCRCNSPAIIHVNNSWLCAECGEAAVFNKSTVHGSGVYGELAAAIRELGRKV